MQEVYKLNTSWITVTLNNPKSFNAVVFKEWLCREARDWDKIITLREKPLDLAATRESRKPKTTQAWQTPMSHPTRRQERSMLRTWKRPEQCRPCNHWGTATSGSANLRTGWQPGSRWRLKQPKYAPNLEQPGPLEPHLMGTSLMKPYCCRPTWRYRAKRSKSVKSLTAGKRSHWWGSWATWRTLMLLGSTGIKLPKGTKLNWAGGTKNLEASFQPTVLGKYGELWLEQPPNTAKATLVESQGSEVLDSL